MSMKVLFTDGTSEIVKDAVDINQDGSGTRLRDKDGRIIASYYSGEVRRVSVESNKREGSG